MAFFLNTYGREICEKVTETGGIIATHARSALHGSAGGQPHPVGDHRPPGGLWPEYAVRAQRVSRDSAPDSVFGARPGAQPKG